MSLHQSTLYSRRRIAVAVVAFAWLIPTVARCQDSGSPKAGKTGGSIAYQNATIHTVGDDQVIENGTILIRDGRIVSVGNDVEIPIDVPVVDASGKHIVPGIVDPYYVVPLSGTTVTAPREVVFNGRVFLIGGGTSVNRTSLVDVSANFDTERADWTSAIRSGITSMHLVTAGYCQTAVARPRSGSPENTFVQQNTTVHVAVSNDSSTLSILRKGLTEPKSNSSSQSSGDSKRPNPSSSSRGRPGRKTLVMTNAEDDKNQESDESNTDPPTVQENSSDTDELWSKIRAGELAVFANADNPSAILHVEKIIGDSKKTKHILTSTGANLYQARESLDSKNVSVIVSPQIDTLPNSAVRFSISRVLRDKELPFSFSLTNSSSQFRRSQDAPLFPIAFLVRSGLGPEEALAALTLEPARLIGLESVVGSLEKGKFGNLVVLDGEPFDTYTQIETVVLEGIEIFAEGDVVD